MYVSNEREKAICRKVSQGLLSEIVHVSVGKVERQVQIVLAMAY